MAGTGGRQTVNVKDAFVHNPEGFNLFQLMYLIEKSHPQADLKDILSVRGRPYFSFSYAPIYNIKGNENSQEIQSDLFGLLGGNGRLPYHFTRQLAEIDRQDRKSYKKFFDIFQTRISHLAYQAWKKNKPYLSGDCKKSVFIEYLHALGGMYEIDRDRRSEKISHAFAYQSAVTGKRVHSSRDLEKLLKYAFTLPITVDHFFGRRCFIPQDQQTRLSAQKNARFNALGQDTVLGRAIYERQSHVNIIIGPVEQRTLEKFLPGEALYDDLINYVSSCLDAPTEVYFTLKISPSNEARHFQISTSKEKSARLGWTSRSDKGNINQKEKQITFKHSFT